MGNVASRADEVCPLYLRDQNRLAVVSVKITNSRNRTLYTILPNGFPATRFVVRKEAEDDTLVEYIQDPDATTTSGSLPNFLLRLNNDDDIFFYFTFAMRQGPLPASTPASPEAAPVRAGAGLDTVISSLTFIFASTPKDLDKLVTREFNADPNLHKNRNVDLVGDYSTAGSPVEHFEWSWKWRPPKSDRDVGGGWRNTCSFVEYDARTHRLNTLLTFSYWVHDTRKGFAMSYPSSPRMELKVPPRVRVPSSQSMDSRLSDSDNELIQVREPPSPGIEVIPEHGFPLEAASTNSTVKVDINCQRPGEDISAVDDGPVFRATMKSLERKTGDMRARMKKVLKKAEAARETQVVCNSSVAAFMEALKEASHSNANAVQPALDHYFGKIATEILAYEKQNADNLQRLIIDPISKLYSNDIKQAESKKKDFDEESRDYYAYVSRYLGQRHDSLKEKKRAESDSKYQAKRRNFELKRFDYSSFMQDLHGGRKDQEVLSQLTRYADTQAKGYLATAKKIEAMVPQLDALSFEVREADKEYSLLRTGREEKRRALEKTDGSYIEPESASAPFALSIGPAAAASNDLTPANGPTATERPRSGTLTSFAGPEAAAALTGMLSTSPRVQSGMMSASPQSKFKGFRDLEEREPSASNGANASGTQFRKEGLLWSLSRPGSHSDPMGLNKQAWHKFWIVLDQGKLSEYINWKQNLEPHMDPIDLRLASVREARGTERRFAFEVITPNFTRVYQATSEEDMKSWILAINNALQSAFEGNSVRSDQSTAASTSQNDRGSSIARDLFGKSLSFHGHRSYSTSSASMASKNVTRNATVGERPGVRRNHSSEERVGRLLSSIREADAGNSWCADCGSDSKVEWVSINLGIVVCIECSGIHRSLGTHISKIRSLTLDTVSFTQDITELLLLVGNRVSNMIWEATLRNPPDSQPPSSTDPARPPKPAPKASREQRLQFITAKYARRAFVAPLSPQTSRYPTPDDTLLACLKQNDLVSVLYALALAANTNVTDRSRFATPAFYLALAAADPAPPNGGVDAADGAQQQGGRKAFPLAELLVQNGADIPTQAPPFPLSRSAQAYVDFKRSQKLGPRLPQHEQPASRAPAPAPASTSAAAPLSSSSPARIRPGPVPVSFPSPPKLAAVGEAAPFAKNQNYSRHVSHGSLGQPAAFQSAPGAPAVPPKQNKGPLGVGPGYV